ncbi:MAG: hypothetical protein AAGI45_19415 [Cyanobacteria bacterium P01_H01_bin.26]
MKSVPIFGIFEAALRLLHFVAATLAAPHEGPVLDGDWLKGLTWQTQEIGFSDLVQRSGNVVIQKQDEEIKDDSTVSEVDKQLILALVDELTLEEVKAKTLSVSHVENVSAWVQALSTLKGQEPQKLIDLQQQLKMPLVEVWIAALLGQFELEQRGDFYETQGVWIS